MAQPSKQKLVEEYLTLQDTIDKATERQGKIKAIIAKDLPLGTHPIAGVNVQVKSGSKLFQKAEFETKYTPEDHPEYYAPTVAIDVVKASFAPIELDQFYKTGAPSVVIPKRKV